MGLVISITMAFSVHEAVMGHMKACGTQINEGPHSAV
jgi:hypothetical protein